MRTAIPICKKQLRTKRIRKIPVSMSRRLSPTANNTNTLAEKSIRKPECFCDCGVAYEDQLVAPGVCARCNLQIKKDSVVERVCTHRCRDGSSAFDISWYRSNDDWRDPFGIFNPIHIPSDVRYSPPLPGDSSGWEEQKECCRRCGSRNDYSPYLLDACNCDVPTMDKDPEVSRGKCLCGKRVSSDRVGVLNCVVRETCTHEYPNGRSAVRRPWFHAPFCERCGEEGCGSCGSMYCTYPNRCDG